MSLLPPLPLVLSLEVTCVAMVAAVALLRVCHRDLWKMRALRVSLVALAGVILVAHGAWSVGLRQYTVSYWGAAVASCLLVLLLPTVASLPVAAGVRLLGARLLTTGAPKDPLSSPSSIAPLATHPPTSVLVKLRTFDRRTVLRAATISIPLAAFATAARGLSSAAIPVAAPIVPFAYPGLHPDLEGFTILQLSDLHLGMSKNLSDLERLLDRVASGPRRPDLIVLTGDIAEDLSLLAPALSMIAQVRPRAGVLASLGNHEYLRDIRISRPLFDASDVRLLVDEGVKVDIGGARLFVGGTNDPVVVRGDLQPFFRHSVDRAMRDAGEETFRLLLAHRPEAFDEAARRRVHLTLSGHTHGGQIGFNGKSAFEPLWPDGYLWGAYARERSRLYTTSGFGDWFPLRLGCPAEAPRLVLTRGA